jgi:hypothetical protein
MPSKAVSHQTPSQSGTKLDNTGSDLVGKGVGDVPLFVEFGGMSVAG